MGRVREASALPRSAAEALYRRAVIDPRLATFLQSLDDFRGGIAARRAQTNFNPRTTSMTTHSPRALSIAFLLLGLFMSTETSAVAQEPIPYGAPISLADAKKVIAAAEAEANKNKWPVAIAVVDPAGFLVAFSRLDNTQLGSVEVAQQKARTAALFRRPTKVFEDMLEKGGANNKILKLPGALPIEGGLPIIVDGKIIGAIGVSGVKSSEDGVIAAAGVAATKSQ